LRGNAPSSSARGRSSAPTALSTSLRGALATKQSILAKQRKNGLLRCARNDVDRLNRMRNHPPHLFPRDGGRGCDKITRRAKFRFRRRANHVWDSRILSPRKGRWPSSQTLGWDAVDAAASGAQVNCRAGFGLSQTRERSNGAQTNGVVAYGKTVWFRHPLLVPSCRWRNRSNRIRSAIKPAATVTNKRDRRGDHA
jgi:hypothetical protein